VVIPAAFIKFGPTKNFIQVLGKIRQLHSNLGEVKNVSINWKNLGKFQQTESTLAKQQ